MQMRNESHNEKPVSVNIAAFHRRRHSLDNDSSFKRYQRVIQQKSVRLTSPIISLHIHHFAVFHSTRCAGTHAYTTQTWHCYGRRCPPHSLSLSTAGLNTTRTPFTIKISHEGDEFGFAADVPKRIFYGLIHCTAIPSQ